MTLRDDVQTEPELEPETIRDLEPSEEEAREVAGGSQRCQLPRPEGGGAWSG